MYLYVEKYKIGDYSNISLYTALEAFFRMGFQIIYVESFENLQIKEDNIFLGSIQFIHTALKKMNQKLPDSIDYPNSLDSFLGRKIWASTINKIADNPNNWNVFVKPKYDKKKFTGRLINSTKDLIGCGDVSQNTEVWVSEPKNFISEWRVFVRKKQIVGVKFYKGDWRCHYNASIIEDAVNQFDNAPAGYSLDFGLTDKKEFLLVEGNDGYGLGNYGLFYIDYAKLLASRWAELTKQRDLCEF